METALKIAQSVAPVGAAFFAWLASRHAKRLNQDLQTNHGKRPGEYLEMIGEVRVEQAQVRQDLAAHTIQDSRNFQALASQVAELHQGR